MSVFYRWFIKPTHLCEAHSEFHVLRLLCGEKKFYCLIYCMKAWENFLHILNERQSVIYFMHIMYIHFVWMPLGQRLRTIRCSTKRYKFNFVPEAIQLCNKCSLSINYYLFFINYPFLFINDYCYYFFLIFFFFSFLCVYLM